jgi:hypothetical protein
MRVEGGAWSVAKVVGSAGLGVALESPPVHVVGPHGPPVADNPPPTRSQLIKV